ncbi:terpene cyclase/mutase family protein [Anaerophilus nitritogenes]|uniref:terpene cyclase/mutase family protein n=1 Tax=Anaerophilus nitritogenes TaxID=2498136 RepID=UPI00101C76D5|nr:terpene cyclase/mutase family protein [Anaerophilus nitritogenes]
MKKQMKFLVSLFLIFSIILSTMEISFMEVIDGEEVFEDDINTVIDHVYNRIKNDDPLGKNLNNKEKEANSPIDIKSKVKKQIDNNLEYILKTIDKPEFGNEWDILCLGRGEYAIPAGYYETYYNKVVDTVKELMEEDPVGKLNITKGTEHSRLILGLTSIGQDIKNVGGYDITKALSDFDYVTTQGINGPIFALIALDSKNYQIPIDETAKRQNTRDLMIQYILDQEINKGKENVGGWNLNEKSKNPDVDITAMTIQGLTPYYNTNENVKEAVDRAIQWLASTQREDGGYESWGCANSESCAQVIVALTGLGIDPYTDERFIKNGKSIVDALMTFAVAEGGFMHIKAGENSNGGAQPGEVNGMATHQGTYALIAYDRLIHNKNRLYDMTDIEEPKEKIEIVVENLTDDMSVTIPQMSFKAYVRDNKGALSVKVNNETIKDQDGKYNVTLEEGENTIIITAIDQEQNKTEKTYKVYYVAKNLFEITMVSKNDFKNGFQAQIKIKAKNISDQEREATLLITLYNKENEMVYYGFVHRSIQMGQEEELGTGFLIPQEGKYKVKAFVWDNIENMKILCEEPIVVEVK